MNMPPPPPPPPHHPVSTPPVTPGAKKTSPWVWVGVGCLVIVLLGLGTCVATTMFVKNKVGKFMDNPEVNAAKLAIQLNPDLSLESSDDEEGVLTVRNKKTDELLTVRYSDIREGRLEMTNEKGERTAFDLSGRGALVETTDAEGNESSVNAEGLGEALSGLAAALGTAASGSDSGEAAKSLPEWIPVYEGATVRQLVSSTTTEGRSGTYILTSTEKIADVQAFYSRTFRAAGLSIGNESSGAIAGSLSGASLSAQSADGGRTVNVGLTDLGGKTQALITFSERN